MKVIERIALALFSNIILILSVLLCLTIFGWLDLEIMYEMFKNTLENETITNTILGVCVVLILLAIKCVFFESIPNSKKNDSRKDGILIENESGKLMVTKETLENLANSVVKGFENVENITSKVELDKDNNVSVFVSFAVKPNAVIKELSTNLQTRIKEAIKNSLELEVKEVNIRIKNVSPKVEAVKED